MVASNFLKQLSILLALFVVGTLGQILRPPFGGLRPFPGRIGLGRLGRIGGPGGGGGGNTQRVSADIDNCLSGGGHVCFDTNPNRFQCASRDQICNGIVNCRYGEDEYPGCNSADDLISSEFVFETTTSTSTPSATYTSTALSTSTVTGTSTTLTTATSTTTLTTTSTLVASLVIPSTSSVASAISTFVVQNVNQFGTVTVGSTISGNVLTCTSSPIPVGGTVFAGDNDFLFQTITVSSSIAVTATVSCSPTTTIYS